MTTVQERNQDATLYCGDLDQRVTEAILWELMLQAAPVGGLLSLFGCTNSFHKLMVHFI
jgi:hypothetical protein